MLGLCRTDEAPKRRDGKARGARPLRKEYEANASEALVGQPLLDRDQCAGQEVVDARLRGGRMPEIGDDESPGRGSRGDLIAPLGRAGVGSRGGPRSSQAFSTRASEMEQRPAGGAVCGSEREFGPRDPQERVA